MRISRLLSLTALFLATCSIGCIALSGTALAQGGGGVPGGGGFTGGGGNPGGGFTGGGNTGGGNFGGTTGGQSSFNTGGSNFNTGTTGGTTQGTTGGTNSGTTGGAPSNSSQPLNLDNQLNITPTTPTAPDERNQGFIGPNGQQIITQGFVGAATQLSGAQPSEGTSFGGGVNTQGGGAGGAGGARPGGGVGGAQGLRAAGGAGGFGANQMGGLGGFGANANSGVRRNVRNRLVNQVQVNRVPAAEVAQRFTSRLDRIPLAANAGNDVKIAIERGTAVITGSVPSAEASTRIERQLRLEPGVYKIDNRLEVNR